MRSYLQVQTVPTADTPGTSLMLVFADACYFFGHMHEGSQRVGGGNGAKYIKLKEVFISGTVGTHTIGGLLGTVLTVADTLKNKKTAEEAQLRTRHERYQRQLRERRDDIAAGAKKPRHERIAIPPSAVDDIDKVSLHGGPNLTHAIATARSFIFRLGVPISTEEYSFDSTTARSVDESEPTWSDSRIRVWAMTMSPARRSEGNTHIPQHSRKRSLDDYMSSSAEFSTIDPASISSMSAASATGLSQAQTVRENIVHEMFRSKWRADALVETSFGDVEPSAKVWVRDPTTNELLQYTGATPDKLSAMADLRVLVRQPWPGALIKDLPTSTPSDAAVSYVVRNQKQRGKFNVAAADTLGVAARLRSKLANGEDVTLDSGQHITPDMVLEPSKEGQGFAVFDLPTEQYIQPLSDRLALSRPAFLDGIKAFVWILGSGVSQQRQFQTLLDGYPNVSHIVSSPDHCPNQLTMRAAAANHVKNQLVDSVRFSSPEFDVTKPWRCTVESARPKGAEIATPGLRVSTSPKFQIERDGILLPVDLDGALKGVPEAIRVLATQAKARVNEARECEGHQTDTSSRGAEVIFLGTGSAIPSPHRNVSATLLRVPSNGSYLFDAGENTLGQLRRKFSPEQVAEILKDLRMIWISHLHADHHLGTAGVIKAWYEEIRTSVTTLEADTLNVKTNDTISSLGEPNRLVIVGHGHMLRYLREFSGVESFGFERLILLEPKHVDETNWTQSSLYWHGQDVGFHTAPDEATRSAIRRALPLSNLVICKVSHCWGAYAISVTFDNGFKFSYSGDCRPSKRFAEIGKGSDVLVHEATFNDDFRGDAKAKKHCTISEAIGVGLRMQAKNLILTHFSQRFSKIPTMREISLSSQVSPNLEQEEEDFPEDDAAFKPLEQETRPSAAEPTPIVQGITDSADQRANTEPSETESSASKDFTNRRPLISSNESPVDKGERQLQVKAQPEMHVAVAFDYMSVRVEDIQHLHHFTPALVRLHAEDAESETGDGS